MMKKWIVIPVLAGAVVIGGVAMVGSADKNTNQSTGVLGVKAVGNDDTARLTIEEVEAKAVETVGGIVTEIDYDRSDDVYEVEVESDSVSYELDIDAVSGEVVKQEMEDKKLSIKSDEKVSGKNNKNYISAKEAIAIAVEHSPGTVKSVELDNDDNHAHFEIEIKDGKFEYEFEIDAITGKILDFEKDRDDD